jgi:hypothetical protein
MVNPERQRSVIAILGALAVAIALLWRPITEMGDHIWGPSTPWTNGDFIGAWWLFWAMAQPEDWLSQLHWPHGEASLWTSFPNPFDAMALGPVLAHLPFPGAWNAMVLGHHLGNIAATVCLARAAGVRGVGAFVAGALIAASPVMLLEIGLGHTLTAAVWPGLLGLALLLRGHDRWAGLLIGVQGLCYLYTGLGFGLVALLLKPRLGLALALVVVGPYLWWLAPQLSVATAVAPPDGHNSLPLDGLFWLAQQQWFRAHPVLLVGFAAPILAQAKHRPMLKRWAFAAMCMLLLALGPTPSWVRNDPLFISPLAWLVSWTPGMGRMHHPVRFTMVLLPLLAVMFAHIVSRKTRLLLPVSLALVALTARTMDDAVGWRASPTPPGVAAAEWVAERGTAVVDLGSRSMEGLALQPIHRLPLLAGFHPRHSPPPHLDPTVFRRVDRWADGEPQPGLAAQLRALGFSHVLAIQRGAAAPIDVRAVEAALGSPVAPGVYAL